MNRDNWRKRGKKISRLKITIYISASIFFIAFLVIGIVLRANISTYWSVWITVITAVATIAQATFLLLTLDAETVTKRFEFIEEYNFHFLTSPGFQEVEQKLEACYQASKEYGKTKADCEGLREICYNIFQMKPEDKKYNKQRDEETAKHYQNIINYLAYLESFVPLIIYNRIKMEEVDDLYGYRYFIAMNNPVLQDMELFPDRDYYNGCFSVYERWRVFRMNKQSLQEKMPMDGFDLLKRWESYKESNGINRDD